MSRCKMKQMQRNLAITAWRRLSTLPESRIAAEDKYFRLLGAADQMEREGLITSKEWLKLAQQAAALFSSEVVYVARPKQ
jgi:hypothetical protein